MLPGYVGDAPHLPADVAGVRAREAEAKALVITHLTPGVDPTPFEEGAAEGFGQPVGVARMNETWEV